MEGYSLLVEHDAGVNSGKSRTGNLSDNAGVRPKALFLCWEGGMKRVVFWIVVLGIVMIGLAAGPDLWAAPGQSPARQTVPTRTPQPPPTKPPPPPTEPPPSPKEPPPPPSQPTPDPTAAQKAAFAGGASDSLLPEAGGSSTRLHLSVAMIMAGLLVLAKVKRRV